MATRVRVRVRRWGSSVAAVIPPEALKAEGIRVGDEVDLEVARAGTLADLFGALRGWKVDAQALADEDRDADRAAERRRRGAR
ncbi:MAG: AbrB/MazE/SpoVT family DNA-binding domain-containing protein [Euryarchaeota archaeon]|nr:AbrB/MazE/SpoVT family DNA-binding domain-containing protein [Euryarchaeota archaeon]